MMKKITAKEAYRLADKLGQCFYADGTTFYATNEDETEIYDFDSKKERDEFVERNNGKIFTNITVDGKHFENMYDALTAMVK